MAARAATGSALSGCPACGGRLAPWITAPGSEPADPGAYELERCADCGSAVTAGEAPAASAYETGAYARPPLAARLLAPLLNVFARRPVRELRRAGLRDGSRVLDAGAGRGRVLAELARAGYAPEGIDPAPRGPGVAAESIEEHDDDGLDAVVLWHVLEHLEAPEDSLERVGGWLRPGGLLVVAVPNLASAQARIAGPGWHHLDLPRHRTHLTARGLERMLERHGFELRRLSHRVPEHNPGGMWMALLARLGMTPSFPFHLLKRSARPTPRDVALTLLGILLLPVALIAEWLAQIGRRGGTVVAVAHRR